MCILVYSLLYPRNFGEIYIPNLSESLEYTWDTPRIQCIPLFPSLRIHCTHEIHYILIQDTLEYTISSAGRVEYIEIHCILEDYILRIYILVWPPANLTISQDGVYCILVYSWLYLRKIRIYTVSLLYPRRRILYPNCILMQEYISHCILLSPTPRMNQLPAAKVYCAQNALYPESVSWGFAQVCRI